MIRGNRTSPIFTDGKSHKFTSSYRFSHPFSILQFQGIYGFIDDLQMIPQNLQISIIHISIVPISQMIPQISIDTGFIEDSKFPGNFPAQLPCSPSPQGPRASFNFWSLPRCRQWSRTASFASGVFASPKTWRLHHLFDS